MGLSNEEKLSLAAIIFAVAAFIISVEQVLRQYLATADGYRRCQKEVVGPWKRYTKRPRRYRQLRLETQFATPFIQLDDVLDSNFCSLPSGRESLVTYSGDLVVKASEIQDGSNSKWVCWVQLLEELQTFHRMLLYAFPETRSSQGNSVPTRPRDDQRQYLRYPSFSVEKHSWDFMPSDVLKPLARRVPILTCYFDSR
jgi:hypothetical protein